MRSLLLSSMALAIAAPGLAHATTVYPGCAVPTLKASHHTFYIDPVNGSQSGDGSAAKPWHTLAEVLNTNNKLLSTMGHNTRTFRNGDTTMVAINPTAPIKPGDVLMLKSGNHGDVSTLNSFNSDFITVMAAPGQTPLLTSLTLVSSGKWIFQGLKIMGMKPVPGGVSTLVSFGRGDWLGLTQDVVLDSNTISSTDDTSSWSASDWNTKPDSYLVYLGQNETCFSVTNNSLSNGANAIAMGSWRSLVQGNTISRMRYDGIDFYGSYQNIKQNTIKDEVNNFSTDILHPDGIQGWSVTTNGVVATNVNDIVDSNTIIQIGDGKVNQLQGISIFDGVWTNLDITNNVVVTDVYNGITMAGGNNVNIMNNTVLGSDPNFVTWITIGKTKSGQMGRNIVVRNNIATSIQIGYPGPVYDHNVITTRMYVRDAANKLTTYPSGTVGNANKIAPSVLSGFVTADAASATYNLRLRATSVAVGAGVNTNAPAYDITSRKRTDPYDVGAYQH